MRDLQRQHLRERIAQVAARLMVEHGIRDYHLAKRKALSQLRVEGRPLLPTNREVEEAVAGHLRLFHTGTQPQRLDALRRQAVSAMRLMADFNPHLVGSVLTGTADAHSHVCLHVYADPAELVNLFLDENGLRFAASEIRLTTGNGGITRFPTCRFVLDEDEIELVVFSQAQRGHPPLSPIDGKPMRRAGLGNVTALLEDSC